MIFIFIKKFYIFTKIPIKNTLNNSTTIQYTNLINQLTTKTKNTIRNINPNNNLTFLKIKSKKHEIIITPNIYTNYIYIYYIITTLILNLILNYKL